LQALQRKHEGLERDLAALGERVHALDADAARLTEQHPEQAEEIQRKGTEINQAWNDLVARVRRGLAVLFGILTRLQGSYGVWKSMEKIW